MKGLRSILRLPERILREAAKVGFERDEKKRSGTYFLVDHSLVVAKINELFAGKLEVMDTKMALEKHEWLRELRWKLVEKDKYCEAVEEGLGGGYFVRILPNADVVLPIQSCLLISQDDFEQRVHNIIVVEEGSKATIITGCLAHPEALRPTHFGISEFFLRRGSRLNFTMIHNWREDAFVRPRTAALLEDGATFVSNYVCLKPVKDLQMFPFASCSGEESFARFTTTIFAQKSSKLDVGCGVSLEAKQSRGEIASRAVAKDSAIVTLRGRLVGEGRDVRGHLECRGLILSEGAKIVAIPELKAERKDLTLTHEAAIGKIAEKEVAYLMSRRLSRREAEAMLIRGFLEVETELSPGVDEEVRKLVSAGLKDL